MIKVNIDTTNLSTPARIKKAKLAAFYLEQLVNSELFKIEMTNIPKRWRKGSSGKFKDLPSHKVYEYIMSGKEEWNGETDHEIDLIVKDYSRFWSKVVGYMVPGQPTIYVNTKFFDTMPIMRVVSNFLHEYGHTLGMRHSGDHLKESLPYYLNYVVEKIFYRVTDAKPPRYRKVCRGWWIFRRCKLVKA